jgi:hypothetical protein
MPAQNYLCWVNLIGSSLLGFEYRYLTRGRKQRNNMCCWCKSTKSIHPTLEARWMSSFRTGYSGQ